MERALAGAAPRVRVSLLSVPVPKWGGSLPSREWIPGAHMGSARKLGPLCCKRGGEESMCGRITLNFKDDESARSVDEEVKPRNILERIIWDKEVEVSQRKQQKPLAMLRKDVEDAPPVRDFIGALRASYERTGVPALIAEVKKASPSRGVLREDFDPVWIAKTYEENGAACLSILTDEKYFQGRFENLEAVRRAGIMCPLLCKEFIIDSWQIYYARSKGADAILLIAGVLPDHEISYMTGVCRELGLAALVEVHDEKEMKRVLDIDGLQLIGINNRNLETFKVDISNTKKLLKGKSGEIIRQRGITVVGESGLFTPTDISYVQDAGVRAVLVGESLVKQRDPGNAIFGLFAITCCRGFRFCFPAELFRGLHTSCYALSRRT